MKEGKIVFELNNQAFMTVKITPKGGYYYSNIELLQHKNPEGVILFLLIAKNAKVDAENAKT